MPCRVLCLPLRSTAEKKCACARVSMCMYASIQVLAYPNNNKRKKGHVNNKHAIQIQASQ